MTTQYAKRCLLLVGLFCALSMKLAIAQTHNTSTSVDPGITNTATHATNDASAEFLATGTRDASTPFRLLIIPVYFAADPDCDPNCPVGDYDCDNFQPILWMPSLANIWNTYFCSCGEEPCDHCMTIPCDHEPCNPQYPPADELSINDYYVENSMGHLHLTGDVTHHYELVVDVCPGNPTVAYDMAEAAVAAAQSDLVNGPQPGIGWDIALNQQGSIVSNTYDGLIILHPQVPSLNLHGWTNRARRILWQSGLEWRVGCHELGHLMVDRISHSGSWQCTDTVWEGQCTATPLNDYYDIMGFGYGHFKVPHKILSGWLREDQMRTLNPSDSGIHTLTPLETPDGLKALRIPRNDEFYHFEFRQPIEEAEQQMVESITTGFPNMGSWSLDGLISYRTIGGASGQTYLMDLTPNSIVGTGQQYTIADQLDGMLREGQTYSDPSAGFITVLEIRNSGTPLAEIDVEVVLTGDCNQNSIADACDLDCQGLGGLCNQPGCGAIADCNHNDQLDPCEVEYGTAADCTGNGIPDECDIAAGYEDDCNANGIPDPCDLFEGNEADCNTNGIPDSCDLMNGIGTDCDDNGFFDACELYDQDCNDNSILDTCDIASASSLDTLPPEGDGIPDECQEDCNVNGIPDVTDLANDSSLDCNENQVLDECEPIQEDCNGNGILDECDLASHYSSDCTANGIPDECDLASGTEHDCQGNEIPDVCELEYSWQQLQRLDTHHQRFFGHSLDIQDDVIIVGASGDSENGLASGAAYLFEQRGSTWHQTAKLMSDDVNAEYDLLGSSVDIEGDFAIVGAPHDSDSEHWAGAAYLFQKEGNEWTQLAKLTANPIEYYSIFGFSVALEDSRVIVGAPWAQGLQNRSGAVYVFEQAANDSWYQTTKLMPSDGGEIDRFGAAVAIEGNTLVIGAEEHDRKGAVYVFQFDPISGWHEQAKLEPDQLHYDSFFGTSVDIQGNRIVAGAVGNHGSAMWDGVVYVFEFDPLSGWQQAADLFAENDVSVDGFGLSVALDGNSVLIGAPYSEPRSTGAAYLFQLTPAGWRQKVKLSSPLEDDGAYFGNAVALSANSMGIGARYADLEEPVAGAVFAVSPSLLDCNDNGIPDECELMDQDCNSNRVIDSCDVHSGVSIDRLPPGGDGIPDECQRDCNSNGIPDSNELASALVPDCNRNGIPDSCDLIAGPDGRRPVSEDCNDNGIPDECEYKPCIPCDINGDGRINTEDKRFLEECLLDPNPDRCRAADLDGDGKVSELDQSLIDQCLPDAVK